MLNNISRWVKFSAFLPVTNLKFRMVICEIQFMFENVSRNAFLPSFQLRIFAFGALLLVISTHPCVVKRQNSLVHERSEGKSNGFRKILHGVY